MRTRTRTRGFSPKAIAAVVAAVMTYVLGQTVLELPAIAVVAGQAVLVGLAAFAAGPGTVYQEAVKRRRRRRTAAN